MIGEIIHRNGVDLLVIDMIDGKPFVVALSEDIETSFGDYSNDYRVSTIKDRCERWFEEHGFTAVPRTLDLTAMDGSKDYGEIEVAVAPLTFDEYRKYSNIIKPHIEHWFWTATPWCIKDTSSWGTDIVCVVGGVGSPTYNSYGSTYTSGINYDGTNGWLAPALILDIPVKTDLSKYTIDELCAEIKRRTELASMLEVYDY